MKTIKIPSIFALFLCSAVMLSSCAESREPDTENSTTIGEIPLKEAEMANNTKQNTDNRSERNVQTIVGNPDGPFGKSGGYIPIPEGKLNQFKDQPWFDSNLTYGEVRNWNVATNQTEKDITPQMMKEYERIDKYQSLYLDRALRETHNEPRTTIQDILNEQE